MCVSLWIIAQRTLAAVACVVQQYVVCTCSNCNEKCIQYTYTCYMFMFISVAVVGYRALARATSIRLSGAPIHDTLRNSFAVSLCECTNNVASHYSCAFVSQCAYASVCVCVCGTRCVRTHSTWRSVRWKRERKRKRMLVDTLATHEYTTIGQIKCNRMTMRLAPPIVWLPRTHFIQKLWWLKLLPLFIFSISILCLRRFFLANFPYLWTMETNAFQQGAATQSLTFTSFGRTGSHARDCHATAFCLVHASTCFRSGLQREISKFSKTNKIHLQPNKWQCENARCVCGGIHRRRRCQTSQVMFASSAKPTHTHTPGHKIKTRREEEEKKNALK